MLWAARIISGLFVVTLGYTWTVGQSGLRQTNHNLCELWSSISPWAYKSCEHQSLLLIFWALGVALALGFFLFDIYRIIQRRGHKRYSTKMFLGWILLALCLIGTVIALSLIASSPKQKSAGVDLRSIGLKPPEGIRIQDEVANQSMAIGFLNISNSDGKTTLFRRSWSYLSSGRQIEREMSFHKFYVAIENKSKTKTLRNARLVMSAIRGPGGNIFNQPLLCDRTETDSADIPPLGHDYFLIGEGVDGSDAGLFQPKFVSSGEYDQILAQVAQRDERHVGFVLNDSKGRKYTLLRNNGYKIEIIAYADDTPPIEALLILNTRTRIDDTKTRIDIWLTGDISA